MQYPYLQEVQRYREMTSAFGGYNHQLSCEEGQFFDMKNMTSQYFPVLSPRNPRGIIKKFTNLQGILDKGDLMWIDDGILYKDGEVITTAGVHISNVGKKAMTKMGAYVIIMPDKVWYNTDTGDCGYMEASYDIQYGNTIEFKNCDSKGAEITVNSSEHYKENEATDGDYMYSTSNGSTNLKVYSSTTKTWATVRYAYTKICASGIGKNFEKGDGVKITLYIDEGLFKSEELDVTNIFINKEDDGSYSTNTTIIEKTDDTITIIGIVKSTTESAFTEAIMTVERTVPDMEFITECNNRLWGCSRDGHEIYCCKLGDVKNWNVFQGISTDSWVATIGSDGKFTGATTFLGYPIFFKEDGLVKVSVSSTGGHQTKETKCRGVQQGSENSLVILNETLYYKSTTGVCMYTGSVPMGISDELGEMNYYYAVGGSIGEKYYLSMRDKEYKYHLFVYDTKNGIWCKEDNTEVLFFCKRMDELYFIDKSDYKMKSVNGTLLYGSQEKEEDFSWFAESGNIGYSSPDNKYVSRINLRISLEFGTNVDFYIQYDSNGKWEHKFNMSGKGTRTFTVPIIPKRCDHFKYKIVGRGGCKIHSIAKTLEQGSDI
jgi:hypothetical protein